MRISDWSSDVCSSDLPYDRINVTPGRAMIRSTSRISAGAVAVALAVILTGCGGGSTTAPSTATPSVSEAPDPTPTPFETEHTDAAMLPTDCDTLASDATRAEAVGDMTLQGDGVGFVRPAPAGAELALGCDWIVGDATGMQIGRAHV